MDQFNVANIEKPTYALVYGGRYDTKAYDDTVGKETPGINIPGLDWKRTSAPSLKLEMRDRIFQKAQVDGWVDANNCGMAILLVTFMYAFCRYSELVNGSYALSMVPSESCTPHTTAQEHTHTVPAPPHEDEEDE